MQTVEILLNAIKSLSQASNIDEVAEIVKKAARKLSGADGVTFVLREEDLSYYVDENAISPLWKGKKFPMKSCISGWVMQNRKQVVIEDIYQDTRIPVDVYHPTFVKSMAMVPIRSDNPLGAIGIYWARNYKAGAGVMELLQSLADSTAVAIENIQLLLKYKQNIDELKRANQELEKETSHRNQLQKELYESNSRHYTTLYSIGDAVISTDLKGHIMFMNAVAEQLTGWLLADAKGRPLTEVFHIINQQTRKTCENPVEIVLQTGKVVGLANHTALISKDGHEYIISDSGSPIRNEKGEITGTVLVFKDDTESHQKSEKIKSFNRIFEESLNEIYIFDAKTLQIGYANKGALKNLGYTLNELLKLTPVDIKPEFDKPSFLKAIKPLVEDSVTTFVFETIHQRKDGTTYPVEVHLQKSTFDDNEVFVAIILDISARKQVEEKLRRSESELKKAQQITHIGSWFLDVETNEVTWTEELYKMYGFDPKLPVPPYTEHKKLFTPESWETLSKSLARTVETGIPYELELRTVRKDRTNGWMWVRGETIKDKAGKTIALWGAAQDISERKENEAKLEESYLQYQMLIDLAADAFFQGDTNGNFILVNKAATQLTGYSLNEMKKMNIRDLFSEPQLKENPLRYDLLNEGQSVIIEREITRKDGSILPVEMNSTKMLDGTYQSFFRDITERKKTEAELIKAKTEAEENEIRYRTLHNASFGGITIHDKGIILDCNLGLSEITGYSTDELIGMDGLLLISEKTRDLVKANIASGYEKPYEAIGVRKNRQEYPLRLEARNIPYKGKPVRVVEFRDITEQKKVQEKINESEIRYRTLVSNSPIVFFVLNPDGVFTLSEGKGLEKLGLKPGQVLGFSAFELYKDYPVIINDIKNALAGNTSRSETVLPGVVFDILYTPFFDNKGKLIEIIGVANDITERKQHEEQLKESQKLLELFFAQSLDGFFFMMLDEPVEWNDSVDKEKALDYVFENQRMTRINSAMLAQYGATEEQYLGLTPNDLFAHDIKHGRQVWKDFFDNGQLHIDTHEKKYNGTDMIIEGDYICLYDSYNRIAGHFGVQKEVTEIRQAEELLRKSKTELEDYFENDISADYLVSAQGEILSCNRTFIEMFGFEEKAQTEKFNIFKLYRNPIDREKLVAQVKKTGKVENHEVDFVTRDGKIINAVLNAIGIFDDKHELRKIRGYVIDITEQKKAQEALQKSEEKYRLLFENNPQPMWIYDLETLAFLEVNQAAIKHYGYSWEEFLSMTLKDIRPVEDIQYLLEEIKKTRSDLNTDGTSRHLKKNGEIIDVEITSHSVTFSDRKARHILINDITERKFVETELLKLSRAVEQSPLSIVITNTNGDIEFVNPTFTQITGYLPEEVKGENPRVLQSGETTPEEYKKLWDTITSGKLWSGEFHNRKKNGELYWESATIAPIFDGRGEIINFIAIKEDITKQKDLNQELIRAKEKAEESDRLKSAFLANMSHEIRTPMNGILGFTELLLEPDLSSEQKEAYINIVNQSGQRMLNTVNDIVEISKIEAGIVTVDLKEVDVLERLDELIRFFTPEATKKGLELTLESKVPKSLALISTDKNKIDSIFTNLIKNAIKYTNSGTIKVGCETIETQCNASPDHASPGNSYLQFYVKDTGIGIPAERQQVVFERFMQADIVDKDARQGSGLGLAITKAYVEMLGGEIGLKSKINEGSTFFFTLPISRQIQQETVNGNQVEKASGIKGLNIVIAEDDENSALYLQTILQNVSSKIIAVKNGYETVEACRNIPGIDLVLMDIQMPGMNGYEATRQIRQFNKSIVIIAQTAFGLSGDREKALEAGCNDYISKPVKKNELTGIIQRHLKR